MMHPAVTGGDISDLTQLFIGCFIYIQTSAIALFFHALCDIIIPPECVVHV